ncbi:MAG: hypothetical protein GF330_04405 [Candidatus Eisenbacteria bacterium]|nr:hypothetical protein [Candidatus Eisenbacteria bacterium]
MNCREFADRLDRLLGDAVTADEARRLREHAAGCPRCERLLALFEPAADTCPPPMSPPSAALPHGTREALTREILARTSGTACQRAAELLPDHADGALGALDRELLAAHLSTCRSCRARALLLARLGEILPQLAEIEPDRAFAAEVLARTSHRTAPAAGVARGSWWQRLLYRPRFALEVAFCGALLLTLVTGGAGPLVGDPSPGRIAARWSSPIEDAHRIWRQGASVAERAGALGDAARRDVFEPVAEHARGVRGWAADATRRAGNVLRTLHTHAQRAETAASKGEWATAWVVWHELRAALPRAWQQTATDETTDPTEPETPAMRLAPEQTESRRRAAPRTGFPDRMQSDR